MNNETLLCSLDGERAKALLEEISNWGKLTTIIFSSGSVFEFKGPFPNGEEGHGFYNLKGTYGFEGHLKISVIDKIELIDKPHRGRKSLSFVFKHNNGDLVFKVFLGRNSKGELISEQVKAFNTIASTGSLPNELTAESIS